MFFLSAGDNLKDCPNSVVYVICGKNNHLTSFCTWPKQPKPVVKFVGYAANGPGCLLIHNSKVVSQKEHINPMVLITIKDGFLTDRQLEQGFTSHFN